MESSACKRERSTFPKADIWVSAIFGKGAACSRFEAASSAAPWTDLYAVGCLIYEMLMGYTKRP